ncbi:MAG: DivIVA domain-containing protein [Acidimicrobiales bacterium]|nr:DivIVA domain-containing protein [Acidimicrobiales bacterium]
MALTPDEIERRTFPIADWGYDRGEVHKFLVEVAATLRYAQHQSIPRVAPRAELPPRADAQMVSKRVVEILKAAEELAAGIRDEAANEAAGIRAQAELHAADRLREVEAQTARTKEQAKRLLLTAQEQAARIVAEAEAEAQAIVAAAEQEAKARASRIEHRARQHAARILRFEADTRVRLEGIREDLRHAIERLTGSEERPIIDLTEERPRLRIGNQQAHNQDTDPEPPPDAVAPDPLEQMIRSAVDRAVEASRRRAEPPRSVAAPRKETARSENPRETPAPC